MKKSNLMRKISARPILLVACVVALAMAFLAGRPQPAYADKITPPPVPPNLEVPEGSKLFLEGHAVGTQNYICMPSGSSFAWTFYGPQAILFSDNNKQIITHFLSPNPSESGTARPTWQHSRDTSAIWAAAVESSSDPAFVAPGAIPWLKLEIVGSEKGPTGGNKLVKTTFIQRLNTSGGVVPSTGCSEAADLGKKAFVPYTADYYFYR